MKPVGIFKSSKKGLQIIHECLTCGVRRVNMVAEFASQCDNYQRVLDIMVKTAACKPQRH
jgi:transcription elongation factor Elf1